MINKIYTDLEVHTMAANKAEEIYKNYLRIVVDRITATIYGRDLFIEGFKLYNDNITENIRNYAYNRSFDVHHAYLKVMISKNLAPTYARQLFREGFEYAKSLSNDSDTTSHIP